MSTSVEGQSCPVCHAYLFDEDDIVYCPVCGAPHHRDCYAAIGHCALEDKHGTEEQYDSSKFRKDSPSSDEKRHSENTENEEPTIRCRVCGNTIENGANFCPHCRTPVGVTPPPFNPFPGTIKKDEEINGVTAEEIARFTAFNPARYVTRFFAMIKNKASSWNWAAFLFPCEWSFFRKCYSSGTLMGILLIAANLLIYPVNSALSQLALPENSGYSATAQMITENIDKIGYLPIFLMLVSAAINLSVRIFAGVNGDKIYMKTVFERIKSIKENGGDTETEFRKKGGINPFFFMLAYMLINYIPRIIFMFIG